MGAGRLFILMPTESLIPQLQQLRELFAVAAPTDEKTVKDYAWIISKALNHEHEQIGSTGCRTLLADYLKLPVERPSLLHSTILAAAIKISQAYPEFRFAAFLKMWGIDNLRKEDHEKKTAADGKKYPSLAERTVRALAHSLLLHPEDRSLEFNHPSLQGNDGSSIFSILPMVVTRIKEATGKDGRKYLFVTLTSADGIEVETISHNLQVSPLHPLPGGKRHYINIGQLYDCLLSPHRGGDAKGREGLSSLSLITSYLSQQKAGDIFPTAVGYIASIDTEHGHMHIYDYHSRHFVATVQRFSREKAGDFVRFIPIIPQASKFKSALILSTVSETSPEVSAILRDIRIIGVNEEKKYATWELIDKDNPVTELLSPLQVSQGEQSPTFTSGYLNLSETLSLTPTLGEEGLKALIYLRRSKDNQKRPYVAKIIKS